jgi:hypothetical protein
METVALIGKAHKESPSAVQNKEETMTMDLWSRDAHIDQTIVAVDAGNWDRVATIAASWERHGWDLADIKGYWVPSALVEALDNNGTIRGAY